MSVPRIGLFGAVGLFVACSSFGADQPVTPGSTDTDAGVKSDAGAPTGADGATPIEEGGTPGPDFCVGATFCDDFEREGDPVTGWSKLNVMSSSDHVAFSKETPRQGASAIRFDVASSTADHHIDLEKALSRGSKNTATLKFSFRAPPTIATDSHIDLAYFRLPRNGDPVQIALLFREEGVVLYVDDSQSPYRKTQPIVPVAGKWNDAVLSVDFAAKSATYAVGGTSGETLKFAIDPLPDSFSLLLGPDYSDVGEAFTLDFDAVRVDLR